MAAQLKRISLDNSQAVRLRFTRIGRDTIREGAPNDIDYFFAEVDGEFFCYRVRTDNRNVSIRSNQSQTVKFGLCQFSVFDFDDVF